MLKQNGLQSGIYHSNLKNYCQIGFKFISKGFMQKNEHSTFLKT